MEEFLSSAWSQLGIAGLALIALILQNWKSSDGKLVDVISQQNNNETKMADAVTELKEQTRILSAAFVSLQHNGREQTELILAAIQEQNNAITAPFESLKARVDEVVALKASVDEMIHIGQALKVLLETNEPQEA